MPARSAQRDFRRPDRWCQRRVPQHHRCRHVRCGHESRHRRCRRIYLDRPGCDIRDRTSDLRRAWPERDLHALQPSRSEYALYRHGQHRRRRPPGQSHCQRFCMDVHTSAAACQTPQIGLASAADFAVLAGSTVTNTGPTIITGADLALAWEARSPGSRRGRLRRGGHARHRSDRGAAQVDLTTAYLYTAGLPGVRSCPET